MDLGAQYVGWSSSSAYPFNGSELLAPLSLAVTPWNDARLYGQTEFANGNYTDSVAGTQTFNLSNLSDTVIGLEAGFKSFSMPSIANIAVNLPTGNPSWEFEQTNSIVPIEFIDSDYRGRGFGMSFLYGFSLQAGNEQYGFAAGYLFAGAFNPNYGIWAPGEALKLGDSTFLSLNRVVDHGGGENDIIRLSAFYFLPTEASGTDLLQMGPNVNASFAWNNPRAFSFEVGGQYYFPTANADVNGTLVPEPQSALAPRFYFYPSYGLGDLTLSGRAKYILANGFDPANPLYDGGGFLLGIGPSYRFKLDASSALRVNGGFDYVLWQNGGFDENGGRVNLSYAHWTFGTHYEVNL